MPTIVLRERSGVRFPQNFHVILVLDTTGSMSSWTNNLVDALHSFASEISQIPSNFFFTVIGFKDHCDPHLTQYYGSFHENDFNKMLVAVKQITLTGGGDTPECVGSGLKEALDFAITFKNQIRMAAYQYVILMGDAPHHGYATSDDDYRNGCCQNDPIRIAARCGQLGMPVCTVALSNAVDTQNHFRSIANSSGGHFVSVASSGGNIATAIFSALVTPFNERSIFMNW